MTDLSPFEHLTPRELQVLELVAQGMTNKQVAQELGIRQSTVRNSLYVIFQKLDVQCRTQAVVKAMRRGLIHPPV